MHGRKKHHFTHFVFSNFKKNLAVYEIMFKNIVEHGRPQMTIWLMRIAYWIPKAINTHSEYVTHFFFPPHCNNGRTNAPQFYVIRTFPVLFPSSFIVSRLTQVLKSTLFFSVQQSLSLCVSYQHVYVTKCLNKTKLCHKAYRAAKIFSF